MDTETARIEHLKLIQAIIVRLSRNSFAVKSTTAAVSAALIAYTAVSSSPLAALGGVVLLALWVLDAFYLGQERGFRRLYDRIRLGRACEPGASDYFTMNISTGNGPNEPILKVAVSTSLVLLYAPLLLLIGMAGLVAAT